MAGHDTSLLNESNPWRIALLYANDRGAVFAGINQRNGRIDRVSISTIRALCRRGALVESTSPDGGVMARITDIGRHAIKSGVIPAVLSMIDIRPGDTVVYRHTRARCETSATVEKANRVNLKLVADYQPSPTVAAIQLRFTLPRSGVDEIWRDGVKVYDSGRKSAGLSE